ncbi:MAG TPA: hypothetical protein VHG93_24180 [Longimicrobium sp.]|nr:hypothetical protein [Longimicrobium sp.]
MQQHKNAASVAVLALLVTAGCAPDAPVGPMSPPGDAGANRGRPHAHAQVRTPDDEFARASRAEVPGFAGFYLQPDGTPVIRLVDPSQRGAAQRYLAHHLAAARRGRHASAPTRPVFLSAAYDFAQLRDWSEALHPMLDRGDVFLIDVDEVENRVMVGVQNAAAVAAVRAEGARLGVPPAALHVQTQPRPEVRATVRDRFATLVGGIQIAFGSYVCTQGFNAQRTFDATYVLVTNSHCTPSTYAFDGGNIYQNTVTSANLVGLEVDDRGMYECAGTGTSCRRSDAAYIGLMRNRTLGQGGIARTAWSSGSAGGLTVIGEFDIVGRYTGTLPVNSYLDKTGRTSGSTYGLVTHSCVTIGSLRCQDISRVWSQGGDSGAPVYVWLSGNQVQLHGIMWGGPGSDYTTTYSSRLSGIEADLGGLKNLCRPGYGC